MSVMVSLSEDVVSQLLPILSFFIQQIENQRDDASDYRVLVKGLSV